MSSNLKLNPVETNQPFYGKYRYSARFDLAELGTIRGLDSSKIDQRVKERNQWRQEHKRLYNYDGGNVYQITESLAKKLKEVCCLLEPCKDSIKFVVSYDRGYVYTNDVELVEAIHDLDFVTNFQAQEALAICPVGSIALKNPKWTHRTYLRSISITDQQRDTLVEYLRSRENVRLSPGVEWWVKSKEKHNRYWKNYLQGHYFFDHNNDGEILFLNMVVPHITGRTLTIVAK